MNSLFGERNSLFRVTRESACNTLELLRELTEANAKMARNLQISLLFSLLSGNSRWRSGPRIATAAVTSAFA